jgi:hypothetical protein
VGLIDLQQPAQIIHRPGLLACPWEY